jgi:hypothetical protein
MYNELQNINVFHSQIYRNKKDPVFTAMPLTIRTKVGNASCVVRVKYSTVLFVNSNTFINNQ